MKVQKENILAKYDCSFADLCVHFEPLLGWNVYTYDTTKELKKMPFRINSQNIKQAVGIQVTFILKIKLQSTFFSQI